MTAHAKTAEPTIVNGINLDDLFALIGGIKRDASKAETSWRVATTWQGQARSRAEVIRDIESVRISEEIVVRGLDVCCLTGHQGDGLSA